MITEPSCFDRANLTSRNSSLAASWKESRPLGCATPSHYIEQWPSTIGSAFCGGEPYVQRRIDRLRLGQSIAVCVGAGCGLERRAICAAARLEHEPSGLDFGARVVVSPHHRATPGRG